MTERQTMSVVRLGKVDVPMIACFAEREYPVIYDQIIAKQPAAAQQI